MFDRQVVPQCIPSDLEFRDKYEEMTGFIWPETWRTRVRISALNGFFESPHHVFQKDLPPVDAALEPFVQGLLEGVAALEMRPKAVKRIAAKEFPVDLRILEQSFSAIFQASRRAREKKELQENVYEASWRIDHDRLLFDFFIRLVQTKEGDAVHSLADQPITHLEDPLARPTYVYIYARDVAANTDGHQVWRLPFAYQEVTLWTRSPEHNVRYQFIRQSTASHRTFQTGCSIAGAPSPNMLRSYRIMHMLSLNGQPGQMRSKQRRSNRPSP